MSLSRSNRRKQGGYILLVILFALTLMIIAMAAAAPRAAIALQRTKEDELVHRGEQYVVAIRRFYKKFGRYPSSLDQLENTNNIRFLRRKYVDPLTGKDDWKPIQFGQARPPLGFFGQKITTTGGLSPAGVGLGQSTIGQGLGASSNQFGNTSNNTSATNSTQSSGTTGATGTSSAPTGTANNPISGDQLTGRTFGGGAIVGVSVPSEKESLKEFQQQTHYNDWQFVYDPTLDPTLRGGFGVGTGTGVPGMPGSPGFTNPNQNPGGLFNPSNTSNPSSSGTQNNPPMTGGQTTTPH
jgi:type II secretory pathway pseudopilin PulG